MTNLTVPVVICVDLAHEGECEYRLDYEGRAWPSRILLRTVDGEEAERVLLHESLHALLASLPANPLPPSHPDHEGMVRHITRGLWDAGWRKSAPSGALS